MGVVKDMAVFLTLSGIDGSISENYEPVLGDTRRIVITSYPGSPPAEMQDFTRITYPRFQVLTRDLDPGVAEALGVDVQERLIAIVNQVVNGTWYLKVRALQDPNFLRRDESGRTSFVASYEAEKAPTPVQEAGS